VSGLETAKRVSEIEERIQDDLRTAEEALHSAEKALTRAKTLRRDFEEAEKNWSCATQALGGSDDHAKLERRADLDLRFPLFLLATHYWEGRWLLAMEVDLATIAGSQSKKGKSTVIPRWHRRMMLTPCAVATFASMLGKMTYTLSMARLVRLGLAETQIVLKDCIAVA